MEPSLEVLVFAEHARRPEYRRILEDPQYRISYLHPNGPFEMSLAPALAIFDAPVPDPGQEARLFDALAAQGIPIICRYWDAGRPFDFRSWLVDAYIPRSAAPETLRGAIDRLLRLTAVGNR